MNDSTDVNTGVAGSLVMIVLTIAFVILLVSFYRRYKRASKPENEQE
jgi:RsiW-degrading membrane proteinase PrsW (M82 family)